jgi:ATP-dependent RNA helicase RhlE
MAFSELGLGEILLQTLLEQHYHSPTPIQIAAIPAILSQRDVLAAAQTGSGKTAAFALPILQMLAEGKRPKANSVRALIVVPTRELAAQVAQSVKTYAQQLSLHITAAFGGVRIEPQIDQLREGVDVLIATPGRLLDLHSQQAMHFDAIEIVVFDEADRMLELGFNDEVKRIQDLLPRQRQTLLFSATFSPVIKALAHRMLHQPLVLEVSKTNRPADTIEQRLHPVEKARKAALLIHLLTRHSWPQVLVFSATKHGADSLVLLLQKAGIKAAAMHANRTQHARDKVLAEFKQGSLSVLVATDLAARGIDVPQLPCVINLDLPFVAEDYVHRIGRTGRNGKAGLAISLFSEEQSKQLTAIEQLLEHKFNPIVVPGFAPKIPATPEPEEEDEYGNFEPDPQPAKRGTIKGHQHGSAKPAKNRRR